MVGEGGVEGVGGSHGIRELIIIMIMRQYTTSTNLVFHYMTSHSLKRLVPRPARMGLAADVIEMLLLTIVFSVSCDYECRGFFIEA